MNHSKEFMPPATIDIFSRNPCYSHARESTGDDLSPLEAVVLSWCSSAQT
jgi:hypothetical protein